MIQSFLIVYIIFSYPYIFKIILILQINCVYNYETKIAIH